MTEPSPDQIREAERQAFEQQIRQLRQKVQKIAQEKIGVQSTDDWMGFKIRHFINQLRSSGIDTIKPLSVQIIMGSTTNVKESPVLDLPAPNNVVEFLNNLVQQLNQPADVLLSEVAEYKKAEAEKYAKARAKLSIK